MCGRYTITEPAKIATRFQAKLDGTKLASLRPNYNAAPSQALPVIIERDGKNHVELMRWGLVPVWAKDPKIGYRMINARAETLDEKSTWKRLVHKKRCIVPVNGFYEWKRQGNTKQPYYIRATDDELLGLAGLYDVWHSPEGDELMSYTIITTDANQAMRPIHDRMPAILHRQDEAIWLDSDQQDFGELVPILKPYDESLAIHTVSTAVNSVEHNEPSLIAEA